MTRRGGLVGPPRSIALARSIACEHSGWGPISRRDALLEATARAAALHAGLEAVVAGRWAPEPAVLEGLADLADATAAWARVTVREAVA